MTKKSNPISKYFKTIQLFPLSPLLFIFIPVFWMGLGATLQFTGVTDPINSRIYDAVLRARPEPEIQDSIVFIDIDDVALESVGEWPWSRMDMGRMLLEISVHSPRGILSDVLYDLPSSRSLGPELIQELVNRGFSVDDALQTPEDPYFGNVLRSIDPIVLASYFDENNRLRTINRRIGADAVPRGFINNFADPDGTMRVFRPFYRGETQFAVQAFNNAFDDASIALGPDQTIVFQTEDRRIVIPTRNEGEVYINWLSSDYDSSFQHLGIEIFWSIIETRAQVWERFEQIVQGQQLASTTQMARIADLWSETESALYNVLLDGQSSSLESYFALRTAAEQILLQWSNPQNRSALRWSNDGREDETMVLIDHIFNDLRSIIDVETELSDLLRESFAIIAFSATGTSDIGTQPFHAEYVNAGLHGTILNSLLNFRDGVERPISSVPLPITIATFFLLSLITGRTLKSKSVSASVAIVFGTMVLSSLLSVALMAGLQLYVQPFVAGIPLVFSTFTIAILQFNGAEKEKKWLYSAFGSYISQEFIGELVRDPGRLRLGGEERDLSIMFTDIVNFSGLARELNPPDLVALLNLYLGEMSEIILDHGGTIDKFEGDAIVAFFGAPIHLEDHRQRAALAASDILASAETIEAKIQREFNLKRPIRSRIGVSSGNVLVGNLGTKRRMDYTALGLPVNLASRLESANKALGSSVLVSEDIYEASNAIIEYRPLGQILVAGIPVGQTVFELLGKKDQLSASVQESNQLIFQALEHYHGGEYEACTKLMDAAALRVPNSQSLEALSARISTAITTGSAAFPFKILNK